MILIATHARGPEQTPRTVSIQRGRGGGKSCEGPECRVYQTPPPNPRAPHRRAYSGDMPPSGLTPPCGWRPPRRLCGEMTIAWCRPAAVQDSSRAVSGRPGIRIAAWICPFGTNGRNVGDNSVTRSRDVYSAPVGSRPRTPGAVRQSPGQHNFACPIRVVWQIDAVLPRGEVRSLQPIRHSPGSSRTRAAHARKAGPNFQSRGGLALHLGKRHLPLGYL
jgi:hypothetical protein